MRSKQTNILTIIGVFVLLAAICKAEPALTPYLSFTVPGLTDAIEKIELADIDGDGFAEVLVCDGHNLILYSLTRGILLADTLDDGYNQFELELADVNRDSVVDVTVGLFYKGSPPENKIICYDSALANRRLPDQLFVDTGNAECSGFDQGMLEAEDINRDGYNELTFSFETSTWTLGWWDCRTDGSTDIYYSYPGSLLTHLDMHVDGLWSLPALLGYPSYLTHRLYTDWWGGLGPDYTYITQRIVGMDTLGAVSNVVWPPGPNLSCEVSFRHAAITIGCVTYTPSLLTLVSNYTFNVRCEYELDSAISESDAGLSAYALYPDDSTELLWEQSYEGSDFADFIAHPSFADQFFAISKDTLMRFSATDGSLIRKYEPLPEGMKFWDYPYGNDEPYLVIVNHDTVSYYAFGVVTDVDDGPDNATLPETFTLGQPYPNPFNPTVTVPISLNHKGHLRVELFNPLGQRVAVIHDAIASAGELVLEWDATNFASGVYLFKSTFEGEAKSVKAVLLK